jgi:hypothetical protein
MVWSAQSERTRTVLRMGVTCRSHGSCHSQALHRSSPAHFALPRDSGPPTASRPTAGRPDTVTTRRYYAWQCVSNNWTAEPSACAVSETHGQTVLLRQYSRQCAALSNPNGARALAHNRGRTRNPCANASTKRAAHRKGTPKPTAAHPTNDPGSMGWPGKGRSPCRSSVAHCQLY